MHVDHGKKGGCFIGVKSKFWFLYNLNFDIKVTYIFFGFGYLKKIIFIFGLCYLKYHFYYI